LYKNFYLLKFLHNFKDKKLIFKVKIEFYKNHLKLRIILYKVFINLYLIKSLKEFFLNNLFKIRHLQLISRIKTYFIVYKLNTQRNILVSRLFNLSLTLSQYLIENFYFYKINKNTNKVILLNNLIFIPFIFQSIFYLFRLYKFFIFGIYLKVNKYLKRRYFFFKKYKKWRYKKIYKYFFRLNGRYKKKKIFNLFKIKYFKYNRRNNKKSSRRYLTKFIN
jgi:hypothetical protein